IEPLRDYAEGGRKLGELELARLVARGDLEMALCTTSPLSNFNPNFDVLDLPFVLDSFPQADRVLNGPVGGYLLEGLGPHDLKGLGYLEIGFRVISSTVPLPGVDDFRGKRLRVMESRTCLRMAQELGAEGVACPPDRVYAMSRDGLIDGSDRTLPSYWSSKLYEVQPYITETRHLYSAKVILIHKPLFDSLPEMERRGLEDAAREAEGLHRTNQRSEEARVRQRCQDLGIRIYPLDDEQRKRFRDLCQPLYVEFQRMHDGRLLRDIQSTPRI
ncbi:MAG: TRAP transporter substrate-binding protein, partial [Candidatus Eremiobacterota bacterium]